jgi:hypothetical protein
VIQGRTDDSGLWHTLLADATRLRDSRAEIIGGTVGIASDGSFTETVAFTDEGTAREGEQAVEFPPEVSDALQKLLQGAEFYDLREVWFESP